MYRSPLQPSQYRSHSSRSSGHYAPIDDEIRSRKVGTPIGDQVGHELGDLRGLTAPPKGHNGVHLRAPLWPIGSIHRSVHDAGHDAIDTDFEWREIERGRLTHPAYRPLRRAVSEHPGEPA